MGTSRKRPAEALRTAGSSPRTPAAVVPAKRVAVEDPSLCTASTSEAASVARDLHALDDDALARIFRFVGDPKSLARLSLVSRLWRDSLATCGAWRMLCHDLGTAPRLPRKPWRDIYLDSCRRQMADDAYEHELLLLRVTTRPRRGSSGRSMCAEKAFGMGAVRLDRPKQLRALLKDASRRRDETRLCPATPFANRRWATYGGRTRLGVCCRLGSFECAEELITGWNADVNVRDDEGWTPLMEAAFRGNEAIARALLDAGAVASAALRGARADAILAGDPMDRLAAPLGKKRKRPVDAVARTAKEWARARGNARLGDMIEHYEKNGDVSGLRFPPGRGGFVKTNVTPFSI